MRNEKKQIPESFVLLDTIINRIVAFMWCNNRGKNGHNRFSKKISFLYLEPSEMGL